MSERFVAAVGTAALSNEHERARLLRDEAERLLRERVGCTLTVRLAAPGTVPRSDGGKLQRVVDSRRLR